MRRSVLLEFAGPANGRPSYLVLEEGTEDELLVGLDLAPVEN